MFTENLLFSLDKILKNDIFKLKETIMALSYKRIGSNMESRAEKLRRYIDQTNEIRTLSSPQIRDMAGAEGYRDTLIQSFVHIGKLARDNQKILEEFFFPTLKNQDKLDPGSLEMMREFSKEILDAYSLTNMDAPIVYYQARRLLQEADANQDEESVILALDGMVTAAYLMICMTARLMPTDDLCLQYFREGLEAGERLLTYLDPDKFLGLPAELKELVVINSRYIRVVSEVDEVKPSEEQRNILIQRMKDAMALADNPFYRNQLPDYNWNLHRFRVLEYVCSLTDSVNSRDYSKEHLEFIYACTKELWDLYNSKEFPYKDYHITRNVYLYVIRDAYMAGETTKETYKRQLEELMSKDFRDNPMEDVPVVMLMAPLEYLLILEGEELGWQEKSSLKDFYRNLIGYIHQTPKKDMLTFLLSCLSLILKHFIELPGDMDFENMGLGLIAAIHPTTYIHTLSVADITWTLTRHLLKDQPELFVGMQGYGTVEEVLAHRGDIEDYAYQSALCHDFGKLMIAETILTYGRDLLDDEFGFIRSHPAIGAYLLSRYPSTAAYADVAKGHHKWFDDKKGYPEDFSLQKSPYRTIIALVTCADCMDAATDSVGRSYKTGKTLDQVMEEIREESGTRYAPYLPKLLEKPEVRKEIEAILTTGRDENYRKAFYILRDQ